MGKGRMDCMVGITMRMGNLYVFVLHFSLSYTSGSFKKKTI